MVSASLVCQNKKSNKFWNLETDGKSFTTSWGRIGTAGQSTTKSYWSESQCEREAKKIIASKIKKGYVPAITEDLIRQTFIMILSGIAERKNDKEFYYRDDKFAKLATIEFVRGSSTHIVLRHYYENGKIKSEHEWVDGKSDGRDRGWYENGKLKWDRVFNAGKLVKESKF